MSPPILCKDTEIISQKVGEEQMNELQIFNSEEFGEIRTVTIDNEIYFVGKDVAVSLGYKDTSDALKKHVADEDKLTRCFADSGQNRQMYIINESGLYALIFGSKLESAKRFKHWVTSEVLPTIRKTGGYRKPMSTAEQIKLLALGNTELNERVTNVEEEIDSLKNDMPLYGCEIDDIKNHVNRKVVNVLGGKTSEAYRDGSIRSSVFKDIYRQLKREYGCVASYKSIKRKWIDDAHDLINGYEVPKVLEEQIRDANAQIRLV
jgi:prophage antirepressor-like protein